MPPTGLQKLPIEIPFKSGLTEKAHPDMAEPEGMYVLENVELDKTNVYTRRRGYSIMSNAIVNSLSVTGVPKKVGPREDEIFKITEDLGAIGSGGGAGAAGATLFSYSPEADAWRDNGKISSVTLERFAGLTSGQPNVKTLDVGYCNHNGKEFLVMAYTVGEFISANTGIYMLVYDVQSRSMVLEPTIIDDSIFFGGKVQVVSHGQYCVLLFRSAAGTSDTRAVIYDASNNARSSQVTIYTTSARGTGDTWCAASDGTNLYLTTYDGTVVRTEKFTVTATTVPAVDNESVTETVAGGLWVTVAGGVLHNTWTVSGTGVRYWAVTSSTMVAVASPITVSATADAPSKTYTAPLSGNDVVVFWDKAGNSTDDFSVLWRWVKSASTAPATRANTHRVPGIQVGASPFVFNNRVFCPTIGTMNGAPAWEAEAPVGSELGSSATTNFGFCLCEVNAIASAEESATGNPWLTMLPVGTWSRDVSRYAKPGLSAFGGSSDRYIASVRQSRQADTFLIERRGQKTPTAHTVSVWSLDITRINFNDTKRWQHAEGNGATVLAGALPYVFDGMNTHECGYVFRPAIVSLVESGAGNWTIGQEVIYKVVYEWEDVRGARWFSDPSYPANFLIVTDNVNLRLRVRPPSITAKVLGGSGLTGRLRINIYRATDEAPEDFKLLNSVSFMIFDGSGNPIVSFGIFDDDGSQSLDANERAYIFGDELDNSCAPPCRSLIQHRDRLFCIDTENNKLWYTKPFNRDRGIEWSRFQTLALPSRGMALASVEGSLLVFCESQVLALEGQGPSATGVPPDAYSRFMVLVQDTGCSEINAVWRLPGGCIFRNRQGLWAVGGSLGVTYIGNQVEDILRTVITFRDGALDEEQGCLRLIALRLNEEPHPDIPGVVEGVLDYWSINYWYDSARWSVDRFVDEAGTHYGSLAHRGEYYKATDAGVLKRSDTRWLDADENPEDTYLVGIRTGRYRLDSLSSFKRVWRAIANVKVAKPALLATILVGDEDMVPSLDLRLTVVTQGPGGTEPGISTRLFKGTEFEGSLPKSLRMHLKHQKGQTFEISIVEVPSVETLTATDGPRGFSFLGFGLELGMKRGAAKMAVARSL